MGHLEEQIRLQARLLLLLHHFLHSCLAVPSICRCGCCVLLAARRRGGGREVAEPVLPCQDPVPPVSSGPIERCTRKIPFWGRVVAGEDAPEDGVDPWRGVAGAEAPERVLQQVRHGHGAQLLLHRTGAYVAGAEPPPAGDQHDDRPPRAAGGSHGAAATACSALRGRK
uniref:Secreted protein n=1 Tax=Arundo donax TaxID=35708 RepID=A0A0A9DEV1_ARUDO